MLSSAFQTYMTVRGIWHYSIDDVPGGKMGMLRRIHIRILPTLSRRQSPEADEV